MLTGNPLTGASNARGEWKNDDFRPISLSISETVIVRWAHAERQFVSIGFSFHPWTIQHLAWWPQGRPQGKQKCGKNSDFWKTVSHLHHVLVFLAWLVFACDAMCKRGYCRHAVSVRPSVTFVSCAKTNKDIFEIFSPSGSHTILVFLYQTRWRYSKPP